MTESGKYSAGLKTNKVLKFFIGLISTVLIVLMFPGYDTIETDYNVGMVWSKEDLIAPFSFPVYKSNEVYLREVDEAKARVLPVFDVANTGFRLNWLDSLGNFFINVEKVLVYEKEFKREKNIPEEKRTTSEQVLGTMKADVNLKLTTEEWNVLGSLYSTQSGSQITFNNFKKKLIQTINQVYDKRLIDVPKSSIRTDRFYLRKSKIEETIEVRDVRSPEEVDQLLGADLGSYFKSDELSNLAYSITKRFIYPDLKFNKEETDKLINSTVESVPRTIGIVKENERIISKHQPVNEFTKLKLESYEKVRSEQMGSRDYYIQQAGRFFFVMIMLGLIAIFLFKMRPLVFNDNSKLVLISTIILFQCLLSYLSINLKVNYPVEYMIFVPVAAILLTIIFDSRLAFYNIIMICLLVTAVRGGDYDILIPNFSASVLVIYSLRDIKNRTQLFVSMIYVFLGYFVSIIAIGMERFSDMASIREQITAAALNSLLSPILAYGLLIFYERVFRVATDLVFLELSDFNHPLLRELASKAPGTFHHSVVMGNLSEQAAKEIRANQILARVGCYYHDIGKAVSPEYFIENQLDSKSKHRLLNPSLSAKMIIAHVKNGIKLAERYRIPKEVIDFIPMHHGTTLVSYFYQKAKSQDTDLDLGHDYIYRYAGPKPHSKETGIVMLADAVEAATRAIEDPTPSKLEGKIDQIIKERFIEGELDECDLTLRDLINIKNSFLKTLMGIHHHRIQYPVPLDEKEEK